MSPYIFPALPLEYLDQHIRNVNQAIEQRWEKVKNLIPSFVPYSFKSDNHIREEFEELQNFRYHLWFRDPLSSPRITQMDYLPAQSILASKYYRQINNIAFEYNLTDSSYNASTILINDHHFIALQEPCAVTLNHFYKVLINHHACLLVRVKPEKEFIEEGTISYWKDNLKPGTHFPFLTIRIKDFYRPLDPIDIPYFYTDLWPDNEGIQTEVLYELVSNVGKAYHHLTPKGPIACHCASGVGRTGTFIAAYVLLDLLEKKQVKNLSIQEIVLKLSLQRPNLVGTYNQYLSLYRFVDYLLATSRLEGCP